MALLNEINEQRKLIRADAYQMSIGEITNMYRDGDLDIHPAFQRFFRWDLFQKSRWIESLLLGIPTPSIFVAQRPDGVWDVVDGLQRLSTIFEFMGLLKDTEGHRLPPLKLSGTRYLPSLDGTTWDVGKKAMPEDLQRFLKREKLDVKIVKRESDEAAKYELFQRLNTGGSALSNQEIRNCMIVSSDSSFFDWIYDLSQHSSFTNTVPLPERLAAEQFDIELVLRFMLFRNLDPDELSGIQSISDFITNKMLQMLDDEEFDRESEAKVFESVFSRVDRALGEDAFRKYDSKRKAFSGPFLQSAYEIIAMGLGNSGSKTSRSLNRKDLRARTIEQVWSDPSRAVSRTGESAVARLRRTLEAGREIFN